jgi:hypothetical protein
MRQALWATHGPQMQQAWREQLMPDQAPPEFDPDEPFCATTWWQRHRFMAC